MPTTIEPPSSSDTAENDEYIAQMKATLPSLVVTEVTIYEWLLAACSSPVAQANFCLDD